jgi:hypothetical protein
LVDDVRALVQVNEANRIIVYSDRLSAQVGRSFAANAVNSFQRSALFFELVRLCAAWDTPKEDRYSIPSAIALVDDPAVRERLRDETASSWKRHPPQHDDPEIASMIAESEARFGDAQAAKLSRGLARAFRRAKKVQQGGTLERVVNFRDKHLAHSLAQTNRERAGKIIPLPKHGDERELLSASISIVRALHLGVNNAGFDFADARRIARRNARALWHGITIEPLE